MSGHTIDRRTVLKTGIAALGAGYVLQSREVDAQVAVPNSIGTA